MKNKILLSICTFLSAGFMVAQTIATDTCVSSVGGGGGGGNVVVFANYDGGVLNINCDVNIPNLKIGVCTYEPVTINILGPFAGNVTEVRYAGYVATTNHHCSNSPTTTTITGVASGITSVNFLPPSTLSNPNGYSMIVCGYSCSTTTNQGGCNTADQIQDYFTSTMGGTLHSYYTQYGCWSTSNYNVSAGGNCSFTPTIDTTITMFTSSTSAPCAGAGVNFTDYSPGAVSWSWSAPGSSMPSSTTQNLTGVTWSSAGTYTVTLTVSDGSGTCSTSQVITVMDNPDLNVTADPNPICEGDTTILSVTGALQYAWSPSGPLASSWMVQPSVSTWYYVAGTDVNGCSSDDSIQVVVNSVPAAPAIIYASGVLSTSAVATGYQWYLNGSPIAGATSSTYIPTTNGNYTCIVTNAANCSSGISNIVSVSNLGSGIQEENIGINLYPNPAGNWVQITTTAMLNDAVLSLYNIAGSKVYTQTGLNGNNIQISLDQLAPGVYMLEMTNGNNTSYTRLIRQ